jgi:hypothetical protein
MKIFHIEFNKCIEALMNFGNLIEIDNILDEKNMEFLLNSEKQISS